MTPSAAARKAAEILGSKTELAKRLSVKKPTVSQWCSGARPIPAARAIEIERLTGRVVSRSDLCPSFPWGCAGSGADDVEEILTADLSALQSFDHPVQASSIEAPA